MRFRKMLPFMDKDELRHEAEEIINGDGKVSSVSLISMLPFMDEDDIDDLIVDIYHKTGKFQAILPFASEDGVAKLAWELIERENPAKIVEVLPFMDEDDVDKLFITLAERGMVIEEMYPFVSEDGFHEVVEGYLKGRFDFDFSSALPFMDDDDIDDLFVALAQKGVAPAEMYPFVSEDGFHKVLKGYLAGQYDFDFDEAYPYMDEDDIRKLFKNEIGKRRSGH
ncbi:MAG: hypothetical protein E7186_07610 [Erysipelotrichaceae bacterium]|nr:hypothetical protein [Erysipelotrichaceae bacterium]